MIATDSIPVVPAVIWLAGRGDADDEAFAAGIERARLAGAGLQILVLPRGVRPPLPPLPGRIEVAWLPPPSHEPPSGMLGSLQQGLVLLGERAAGPVLVALANRPGAELETWKTLLGEGSKPVSAGARPVFRGKRGHPVVLSGQARHRALGLDPAEASVRQLLEGAEDIVVDDPGVLAPPP